MATDRLQSHEEQYQLLDQARRDNSFSKKRVIGDFWKHQCQLYDIQQQSKGKELALAEGKDLFSRVVVDEDGKLVEKKIVLSEHYGKDNPGLPGGGLAGDAENVLESICNLLGHLANLAPEPATHLAMKALKTVLQLIQQNRENKDRAVIKENLAKLAKGDYEAALRHLNDAAYMNKSIDDRKWALRRATDHFISAIGEVDDDFIRIESIFYAGMCYDLRSMHDAAVKCYREAYNKGLEQCEQFNKEINKLKYNPFKWDQKAKMEGQLRDFNQLMEYLNRLVENFPSTSGNAAVDLMPLSRIPPESEKAIEKFYASGKEHLEAGRYKEACYDFTRVLAMNGDYAMAFARRGSAYLAMKQYKEAEADLNRALKLDKYNTYALAHRGIMHRKMKQYEEAWADFTQVCARGHSLPWIEDELKKLRQLMGGNRR